ncbi:MAG: antitoxin VbhA family protein [Clostridia bacterium]|nr:antitoxin VbhA family protein [Clostridia bacterium]
MQNNDIYKNVLNNAIASVEMEGYKLEENQKEHCLNFVSGKICKEDFIKQLLERCKI